MDRIRVLALHGMSKDAWKRFSDSGYKHYQVVETGFKYNMTDMQAALGLGQLARIEENWERRRDLWSRYLEAFADLPVGLPSAAEAHERHAYHLFQINIDPARCGIDRDGFLDAATRRGIGAGVHYLSLAEHPVYQQRLGWRPEQCPEALRIGRSTVSLPFSTRLDQSQIERVIESVRAIVLGDR
jgi:dTDP-4-amino-4,6-dideoxygalactose transaminase